MVLPTTRANKAGPSSVCGLAPVACVAAELKAVTRNRAAGRNVFIRTHRCLVSNRYRGLRPGFEFHRSGAVTSIYCDAGAGDVASILAREERNRRANFFRSPESAEWHARLLHGSEIAVGRIHVGVDGTW